MYVLTVIATATIGFVFVSSTFSDANVPHLREKRIVGGHNSSIREYPYLVALELNSSQLCGGAILSPYYVITAAHCLKHDANPSSYQVAAGSSLRHRGGTVHRVRSFRLHENYTADRYRNSGYDVAVLRLAKPIVFDKSTKGPIAMFEHNERVEIGSDASIAGWGWLNNAAERPRQVQSVQLRIVERSRCLKSKLDKNQKGVICAASLPFVGTCHGDSGGPLVVNGKLAGVLSSGTTTCHTENKLSAFTELAPLRKWIDERLAEYR